MEAGALRNGSGSTAAISTDNYIRLEEQTRVVRPDSDFQLQRDQPEEAGPAPSTYPCNPRVQDNNGIRKIIRMEASYSAQDHMSLPHRIMEVGRQGVVR